MSAAATAPAPVDDSFPTVFAGNQGRLFELAFVTSLLTVATLGIYRFWMKTRLRRWYWSAIRPGGIPLEYTGDAMEKLLGFLIAVVFLAFYIGVVNLVLMFLSFSLLNDNVAAYAMSFVGIIPLWFYASYRSRRYILARTRWRGVRFALEPGAWGYALRAVIYWLITIASAGLLWPLMTFRLEKYRTDRTWFGSARLHQGGSFTMLYSAYWQVLASGALAGVGVLMAVDGDVGAASLMIVAGSFWLCFAAVYYSVNSRRIMANHKTAGGLSLDARPRTGPVLWIYSLGYFAVSMLISFVVFPISIALAMMQGIDILTGIDTPGQPPIPQWVLVVIGIVLYFSVFLSWSVLRHCFVTMPLWKHYAETLTIRGTAALPGISQRDRDKMTEAEGFAEALDIGAAI